MSEYTAILPHIGHDTYGSHGEVPGSDRALPLALTIEAFSLPVSGVLRFRYPQHTDPLKEEVNFFLEFSDTRGGKKRVFICKHNFQRSL
jgi:hypothetical protein